MRRLSPDLPLIWKQFTVRIMNGHTNSIICHRVYTSLNTTSGTG
jgi:hypothetical protein